MFIVTEAVKQAEQVLADIERGEADSNLDHYLDEAEIMLEEIKGRDFSDTSIAAEDELINADDGK